MTTAQAHVPPDWASRWAALCGAAAAVAGVLVLAGWWLQAPVLKSVLPGTLSMKANTALAFVLAGAALMLLSRTPVSPRRVRAGRWLALLVALIGAATLCEFLFNWQLGIDELLFKEDADAVATLVPGRMAPSTAVDFLLLGLALLVIEWEPRPGFRPAEVLALLAGVVSLVSLAEYTLDQPILYGFGDYTRMAPHTAVTFLVLCAGVLLARPAQGVVGALRSGRVSPLEQRIYAAMAAAFLLVLAGGAWFYHAQEQQARAEVEAELDAIARLKVDQIVQWRTERLGDAAVLTGSEFFAEGVQRWLADPQADLAENILYRFRSMQQHNRYHDVLLVDATGQVRLGSSRRTGVLHPEEIQALATALQTQRPVLTDLRIGPADATPHANLIAPLIRKAGASLRPIGAVILTIEARQFLYPLIQSWPTARPSAETLLVRREGDAMLLLNDLRHRPDTAFRLRIPLSRQEVPEVMAALGREGVFHGADYRGVEVLSVLKQIPDTSWAMVAKVDEAEALAQWRFRAGLIVAVIVALMLALTAATLMVWHQRSKFRALSRSAEALRQANRAYRVLSECNQALVRASDEAKLLNDICRILVEHGGYRLAWIGFAEKDEARSVRPVAHAGHEEGYLEQVNVTWSDTERGRGPTGTAIRTGQACVVRNIAADPAYAPWRAAALQRGYASKISLPLKLNSDIRGALNIYDADADAFDAEETHLLEEMAADLAYGIRVLRGQIARRRAEEALELERSKLAAAFENVDIGLVICDAQGGDMAMNAAALQFHGFTSTQDMHRRVEEYADEWELHYPDGRIMPYDEWPLLRAMRGDYVRDYDTDLRNLKSGHEWACSYTTAPVRNNAGEVILIVMTLLDITERKRTEQEVRGLNASLERRVAERTQQLEEANRAKSDFLANMSHELRTPLNAIIGFSEMLKDGLLGELDEKQRGFVADIFNAGSHLLALINDILDLSKVEAGMMRLEPDAVDVLALLKSSLLIVREKAAAHRIRLDTELDPTLGTLLADARKLKQIVYNLLSNAVKFTPDGGAVRLRARRCPRAGVALEGTMPARLLPLAPEDGGEYLEISVSDTGVGIAEDHLPMLFEPFVQLESSAARRQSGTGLGLSMVRRLAELHGGTVGVASRSGEGSRFSVWLPYREFAGERERAKPLAAVAAAAATGKPLALVIEDDDAAAELIAAQLRSDGYDTVRAATAEEGLVRAAKRKPQLITLDIFLPEMDGWEFMRRLKADPMLADTPVAIITVSQDLDRGLALGARRVLQKPFTRQQLIEALAGLIEQRPNGEPARVLVVDDNVKAVELVATALEAEGYRVMRAYGGAEAIEVARRARPDLVILDLMMPEVSGFEVAKTLRESEQTARIPILVLTAKDLTAEDRARLNGHVNAILEKSSFSRSDLLAELRRALPRRREE